MNPQITIVTPAFNEAENLPALYERLAAVLGEAGLSWEWIIVDDHSRDRTFEVVRALGARDARVRGLRFARNTGSHAAIACGLHHARGSAAIMMAADLQDPPETVPVLLEPWRAGAQVVWAVRRSRPGERAGNQVFARLYYAIMRRWVGLTDLPATGADFFLVDRVVLEAFRRFPERHVSVFALITWMGFRQARIEYDKQPRARGASGWTLQKKIKLVVDSVVSFSDRPVKLVSACGSVFALLGVLLGVGGLAGAGVGALSAGWVALLGVILLVGGAQLLAVGIVGEYVWRGLDEARRRPPYLVEGQVNAVESREVALE